ncbi:MAG: pyridoxamine 5'-phosphate oxidase family protein [Pseudomonadota bacterium]
MSTAMLLNQYRQLVSGNGERPLNQPVTTDEVLADVWAQLVRAKHDRKSELRWLNVATLASDGAPQLRTVVLRDVQCDKRVITFHTDRRSGKFAQLSADSRTALHFHDRRRCLQIRMSGRAELIVMPSSQLIWSQLPDAARKTYLQAMMPGAEIDAPEESRLGSLAQDLGAENFAVIDVEVDDIDWLELKSSSHRRASFKWSGMNWVGQWVAP